LSDYAAEICTCGNVSFVKEAISEKMIPDLKSSVCMLELILGLE
jgi:hypothetical protein